MFNGFGVTEAGVGFTFIASDLAAHVGEISWCLFAYSNSSLGMLFLNL